MQRVEIPEDELRHLYHEEGLSTRDIADRFDVSQKTIRNRFDEYGIEPRSCGHPRKVTAAPDDLRRLYCDEGLTLDDLAERFDCSHAAVLRFLDRYDIETRSRASGPEKPHATRQVTERGYVEWGVGRDTTNQYEHRLVAIGEYGLEAVAGMDVHHRNEVRWDNRPENLEPLPPDEHQEKHGTHG